MPSSSTTKPMHPLQQIAESPSHKLLLKQWLKEEELIGRRVALKESRIDSVRREIAALYCAFFVLHSLLLLLLLLHSSTSSSRACRRSWIPCLTSLALSMSLVWAVRYKSDGEDHLESLLHREKEDSLLLVKCVEELKKKGLDFDLLKEVDALRRAKSLRVEVEAKGPEKVRKWSAKDLGLFFLFAASCVVLGLTRFVLCSS